MMPTPPRPTLFPYTTLFRSICSPRPRWRLGLLPIGGGSVAPLCLLLLGGSPPVLLAAVLHGRTTPEERSEEHTSELQSRRDLVCRLLLEKKKEHDRIPTHAN